MTPITKILVPVDLSARSLGAARYASSIAAEFGAELVFLHALRGGWPLDPAQTVVRARISERAGPHRFIFSTSLPVRAILNTAKEEKADLILIPTTGKPALERVFDGSIAAQVLRSADCPVWVGHDNFVPLWSRPIRKILCGLSLGPRAEKVFGWSAQLARRFNAAVSVIHANKALEANPGLPCDQEWRLWLKKIARDDIRALQTGAGAESDIWVEPGTPLAAIPPLAGQLQADLLVIGKSPRKRIFADLRTLSYDIACRAPCPVVSV